MDDSQIVTLYLQRDEIAIEKTAEKFGGRLRALAQGIVEDLQTAQECENDTYLAAWNAIPPHEPRTYLYPFLARITRHVALNCCRDRSRLKRSAHICQLSAEMEQCIPAAYSPIDDMFLGDAINRFLGALSQENRIIFLRRYWYLDSIATISQRLTISQNKVKTVLFRCRKQLREQLEKEGYTL